MSGLVFDTFLTMQTSPPTHTIPWSPTWGPVSTRFFSTLTSFGGSASITGGTMTIISPVSAATHLTYSYSLSQNFSLMNTITLKNVTGSYISSVMTLIDHFGHPLFIVGVGSTPGDITFTISSASGSGDITIIDGMEIIISTGIGTTTTSVLTSSLTCVAHNTNILMNDGSSKLIQDIQKGDFVAGDIGCTSVFQVDKVKIEVANNDYKLDLVIFEKNALGPNLPQNKLIITGSHKICWKNKMVPARKFCNHKNVTRYYHNKINRKNTKNDQIFEPKDILPAQDNGIYNFYDLQFETDGTYVAEGLEIRSRPTKSALNTPSKELN
ncbi:MAG: hypothetical protein Satyrvirus31_11 [Satyrvirus sp.]|uniref:Hedgehog/Intein (Hint) domain-containing protein n=1 Tax=Satyrvirus sp. TaxID=2487771 RepID=A0A3G5AEU4_9VIRU|nr:MAG: hypothetical protein Satyrvirus31_11 [Satyrvirus sp.]